MRKAPPYTANECTKFEVSISPPVSATPSPLISFSSDGGKKTVAMTSEKKPKRAKSYHSRTLPITPAIVCNAPFASAGTSIAAAPPSFSRRVSRLSSMGAIVRNRDVGAPACRPRHKGQEATLDPTLSIARCRCGCTKRDAVGEECGWALQLLQLQCQAKRDRSVGFFGARRKRKSEVARFYVGISIFGVHLGKFVYLLLTIPGMPS